MAFFRKRNIGFYEKDPIVPISERKWTQTRPKTPLSNNTLLKG